MEDKTMTLQEILHILQKKAKTIFMITGICAVLAGIYLIVATPAYESEALLRIKQPRGIGDSLLSRIPSNNTALGTTQLMSTYAEILKSRSVVVPVIEATEEQDKDGKYPIYGDYILERIETTNFKDTEIIKVAVNSTTPEKAQAANEMLIAGFLNRLTELTQAEQKNIREFIETRVAVSKDELNRAEDALTNYKKASVMFSPTDQLRLTADKVGQVDRLKAENKVALAAAQAKLAAVNSQLGTAAPSIADNATIKQYNAKVTDLEAQRLVYLDKYTAKHPKVVETDNAIAGLKQQRDQEISRVSSLQSPSDNPVQQRLISDKFLSEAEIAVAQSNLNKLEEIDKGNSADIIALSDKEQQYLRRMRDVNVSQDIYAMLAKLLEEAKVAEVSVPTDVQVVDNPTLPDKAVHPQKAKIMALAILLGLLLGNCYVLAKEMMNRTVRTSEDMEAYLGIPVLGAIPDEESLKKAQKAQGGRQL